jgi:hypothetical protein
VTIVESEIKQDRVLQTSPSSFPEKVMLTIQQKKSSLVDSDNGGEKV